MELKGRFFVVMFADSTRQLNVNLRLYIDEFWNLCGCFLNLGDCSNVVLCNTWHIYEHEKWNIVVQGNVHYQKAIENMTQWSNVIHYWPPVKKLVDDVLCLPSSKVKPILKVIFRISFLLLERLNCDCFVVFFSLYFIIWINLLNFFLLWVFSPLNVLFWILIKLCKVIVSPIYFACYRFSKTDKVGVNDNGHDKI